MELYYTIFIFILGAVLGSFYNVVGVRWPKKESIISPPSHCDQCKEKVKAFDLIPIFSFLILQGKCRYCGAKIGVFHMIIEVLTGGFFALAYMKWGFSGEFIVALLFISLFAIITVSDCLYMIIQDKILLIFGGLLLLARIFTPLNPWWDSIAGAVFGFGLFFLLAILSKGGMGGGDIKLYFVIGLVLGLKLTFLSMFFAALIGLLVAIVLKRGFGKAIPFGPSIALGSLIAYFYGESLYEAYLAFFM